jgi:hypothetical protein
MLSNSLQRFVLHYTISDKQCDVTCDFETPPFRSFIGREHELCDALLNFLFSPLGVTEQNIAELLRRLPQEFPIRSAEKIRGFGAGFAANCPSI